MKIISRKEGKERGLQYYFTGAECKRGHLSKRRTDSGQCYECAKERRKRVYREGKKSRPDYVSYINFCNKCEKETEHYCSNGNCKPCANKKSNSHYQENKSACKGRFKVNYEAKKEERNRKTKEYYENNKEHLLHKCREYRENNKERIIAWRKSSKAMEDHRKRQAKRLQTRHGKVEQFLRNSIHRIISNKNGENSFSLCGYSKNELISRVESTFKKGMSWDNYGEWHIDHIIPISLLVKNGCEDPKMVNALGNLRAMWAKENIAKHNNFNGDIAKEIERLKNETQRLSA